MRDFNRVERVVWNEGFEHVETCRMMWCIEKEENGGEEG